MAQDPAFEAMMDRLRQGDAEAASEIFRNFAHRLIALARSRLNARLLRKVDPEDVMQSVFKSFFRHHAKEEFDLKSWDSLWALLTAITLRKCGHQFRHFHAGCRNLQREVPPPSEGSWAGWEALAHDPTPSHAAMLTETVEQLFRGLDARDRAIVELGLQGYKASQISEQLGRAERTVYRLLERIRDRLTRMTVESAVVS
ncbi:MAG: sigma-70 family RNA polymerase sigma factor [Gemmataceae bacterium]|nr:sigma-70 family RNA polymerase sigma factor [Gemmataceae bacterium]